MGYVVTLADGSFLVVDGGGNSDNNHDHLYEMLSELNVRNDGIHITAWILTHEHWDHYDNFYDFVMKYKNEVTIDTMYYATPSYAEWKATDAPGWFTINSDGTTTNTLFDKMSAAVGGIKKVHVKSGDVIDILNCKFEVLYTWANLDDFDELGLDLTDYDNGNPKYKSNNSSMIFRLHLDGSTFLCVADVQQAGGAYAVAKYNLKSDIATMVHHGFEGAGIELYREADPTYLLWPMQKDAAEWHTTAKDSEQSELTKSRNKELLNDATLTILFAGQEGGFPEAADDFDTNWTLKFHNGTITVVKTPNPNR